MTLRSGAMERRPIKLFSCHTAMARTSLLSMSFSASNNAPASSEAFDVLRSLDAFAGQEIAAITRHLRPPTCCTRTTASDSGGSQQHVKRHTAGCILVGRIAGVLHIQRRAQMNTLPRNSELSNLGQRDLHEGVIDQCCHQRAASSLHIDIRREK